VVRSTWLGPKTGRAQPRVFSQASRDGRTRSGQETPVARIPTPILIVDDDPGSARVLARLLRKWGFCTVRSAHSAAAALALAVAFSPRIVLLDIELPDMSGYELARLLHQHPLLQDVRLIALTENGEHPARERARVAGFERYLVKPITTTALREILEDPGLSASAYRLPSRREVASDPESLP
jgi:CheY-like chemotaxis protein